VTHLHATPGELAVCVRAPTSRRTRAAILTVCTLLWLTGVAWLIAHWFFPARNDFGVLPGPWEAPLMRLHGLIAVAAVFAFGWVGAGHILARWSAARNRISGLWLLACAALLVVSGYALYYSTGGLHAAAAGVHEWLGLVAIFAALAHWLRVRARG
jgi:hypothetical protein